MDAAGANGGFNYGTSRVRLRHALAGLEAGVLGALVLCACLMIGSRLTGRSAWLVPNLFATTFLGGGVYRNHFVRASWVGIALLVAVYGFLGVLWGCIWREQRRPMLWLYGAAAGLAVYFVLYDFLWKHINPLISAYAPPRALQIGSVMWGLMLARAPMYARHIVVSTSNRKSNSGSETPSQPLPEIQAEAEVKSGDVIR